METDAGAGDIAEGLGLVELAVSIGVPQRQDAGRGLASRLLTGDVKIAALADRDVSSRTRSVEDDRRAEAAWNGDVRGVRGQWRERSLHARRGPGFQSC